MLPKNRTDGIINKKNKYRAGKKYLFSDGTREARRRVETRAEREREVRLLRSRSG